MNYKTKKLGKLEAPFLGLGCVNFSGLYGNAQTNTSDILNFAFQNGVTFFDTADIYANGQNEELLAASIKKHDISRDKIIISTKCGVVWGKQKTLANSVDNSPQYIKAACEASLKRLNSDYIDLYYLHRIASNGDTIEESMWALTELVKQGKIRHIGLSEANMETIWRANTIYPLTAIQCEYSLLTRDCEINGVLETCRKLKIGLVAYSPLCRGLLSNNFSQEKLDKNDFRHTLPRFKMKNLENNIVIVNQLEEIANEKKCSIVQLSLAWVSAQGNDVLAIPGTKCIQHLEENIASSHIKLSNQDLIILNKLFPIGVATGGRYSSAILRTFNLSEGLNE